MDSSEILQIYTFPCLQDNYAFLIHDHESDTTAVIDTPDVPAIEKALTENDWTLTYILNTHHHWDHAGGNLELKNKTGCKIFGPHAEASRIPGIDFELKEGDVFKIGKFTADIYDTPGHTSGHIVYHFAEQKCAFVGDTLFAMGCGRLFEGTPEQMWNSLQKILQWPDDTRIYCAHEYTQNNGNFALTIEPDNQDLVHRVEEVKSLRAKGKPTIPTTLLIEKKTNPFLRPTSKNIRNTLHMQNKSPLDIFTRVRQLKDQY